MTNTPPFGELLTLIENRSAALRTAVASAPDLDARVPGCPEWTLRDLVAHLGGVQRSWAVGVQAGPADGPPSSTDMGDISPDSDLLEWSTESTQLLIDALRRVGPDARCWTWWGRSDAPSDSGAVARHQVEEAAVHAYDAQEAIGRPEPLPLPIALDSVAEFLVVGLGAQGPWPHEPALLVFAATEGSTWWVDLTPEGAKLIPADGGEPVATVSGTANDLILALFGRVQLERLQIDGDRQLVVKLLDWVDTE